MWRLDTLGCDTGDRWPEQADLWQDHADGKCLMFTDIHAAMAELQSGQAALVERRREAMREASATTMEAAGLYRTVGIPIVEALAAFHRGAYLEAVELLLPVRFDLWRIGGSHRAALRTGVSCATLRPSPPNRAWFRASALVDPRARMIEDRNILRHGVDHGA